MRIRVLAFPLLLCASATWPMPAGRAQPSDPPIAPVYAAAAAMLLGEPEGQNIVIIPSAQSRTGGMRPRRASGPARIAGAETARQVAALLARRGYRRVHGLQHAPARGDAIILILGELRFEPPTKPAFARLAIEVRGTNGDRQVMEFLLKREAGGWRALKMESAEDIS